METLGDTASGRGNGKGPPAGGKMVYRPTYDGLIRRATGLGIRLNELGQVLQDVGDLEGARSCYEQALGILRRELGERHPQVAVAAGNLGTVLYAIGDLPGARAFCAWALEIDEAFHGPQHLAVARDANNLGAVLCAQRDPAGARAYYERAGAIYRQLLPAGHPEVRTVEQNLAELEAVSDPQAK